jgi:hypothetical protein
MSRSMLNLLLSAYTTTRPSRAVIDKQARVGWVGYTQPIPALEHDPEKLQTFRIRSCNQTNTCSEIAIST